MAFRIVLLIALSLVTADCVSAGEKSLPFKLHGYIQGLYRYRSQDGETDHDTEELLSLRFSDKEDRWVKGYISSRFTQDLDGFDKTEPFAAFPDTYGRTYERVSAAYVDVFPHFWPVEKVRLGRQWAPDLPFVFRFDGIHVKSEVLEQTLRGRLSFFAGLPDHLGESSRSLDRIYGGHLELEPLSLAHLSCSYVHIRDTYRIHDPLGNKVRKASRDDLLIFSLRKSLWENLTLSGRLTLLEGELRDGHIRAQLILPALNLGVVASYKSLFKTQTEHSAELDPYVSIVRVYRAYHQFSLELWHDLNEHLTLEGGLTVRRLKRGREVGPFNHEFERYWAGLTLLKWPLDSLELSLLGDYYDTGSDRHLETEVSAKYRFIKNLSAEIGTAYALFKEDRYTLREKTDVRSVFAGLDWEVIKDLSFLCQYTFEEGDSTDCHEVEFSVRWRF